MEFAEAVSAAHNDNQFIGGYWHTHTSVHDGSPAMIVKAEPFTLTNEDGYEWEADPQEWERIPGEFVVGEFIGYTMVTDTRVYEVVGRTAKTITIRPTLKTDNVLRSDGASYPTVRTEVVPFPEAESQVLRRRQDGTFRVADWASPLRLAERIDGKPVEKTDYSM